MIPQVSRPLPDHFKTWHPQIQWQQVAAAGNVHRYEYDNGAANRVWMTSTNSLPVLRDVVVEAELMAIRSR